MADAPMWPDDIYRILRDWDVTQFSYVPDAGHTVLINRSLEDPEVHSVALTTEEEGIAMLAGAHLGGARGVALMQSSGVGNCVNMFSLVKNGQFPMLVLVSMRGDFGEGNPWQMPMGQAVQPILETCGFLCLRVEQPGGAPGPPGGLHDGLSSRTSSRGAALAALDRRQGVLTGVCPMLGDEATCTRRMESVPGALREGRNDAQRHFPCWQRAAGERDRRARPL